MSSSCSTGLPLSEEAKCSCSSARERLGIVAYADVAHEEVSARHLLDQ